MASFQKSRGQQQPPQGQNREAFDPANPLTLELQHGAHRQAVQLPTETLDKSKKYYVTFTINQSPPKGRKRLGKVD